MTGDMSNTGGTTDCSNIDNDVTFVTPSAPPEPSVPPPPYTLYDPNPISFCTSGGVNPERQPYVVGYKV